MRKSASGFTRSAMNVDKWVRWRNGAAARLWFVRGCREVRPCRDVANAPGRSAGGGTLDPSSRVVVRRAESGCRGRRDALSGVAHNVTSGKMSRGSWECGKKPVGRKRGPPAGVGERWADRQDRRLPTVFSALVEAGSQLGPGPASRAHLTSQAPDQNLTRPYTRRVQIKEVAEG